MGRGVAVGKVIAHLPALYFGEARDVGAAAEGPACAGEDDGDHLRPRVRVVEGIGQALEYCGQKGGKGGGGGSLLGRTSDSMQRCKPPGPDIDPLVSMGTWRRGRWGGMGKEEMRSRIHNGVERVSDGASRGGEEGREALTVRPPPSLRI